MKHTTSTAAALVVVAAASSTLAFAHHSAAMFDMEKTITVEGTVKDFQYTNPHSWLIVLAPGQDGKQTEWSFETEGPSTLERAGIKRSSLQVGDRIAMSTHPMKDGRPAGLWLAATKTDGTVLKPRGGTDAPPKPPA